MIWGSRSRYMSKRPDDYGRTREGNSQLLARCLVEAGVTFVIVRVGGWDKHGKIEWAMRRKHSTEHRLLHATKLDLRCRTGNGRCCIASGVCATSVSVPIRCGSCPIPSIPWRQGKSRSQAHSRGPSGMLMANPKARRPMPPQRLSASYDVQGLLHS